MAPKTALNVCDPAPNSGVLVLPTVTAPAQMTRCSVAIGTLPGRAERRRPAPYVPIEEAETEGDARSKSVERANDA